VSVTAADLLNGPNPEALWIRLDLLTRRIVGRRPPRLDGAAAGELPSDR
jgi:hypothetical protein